MTEAELWLREVKQLTQDHTAKWQGSWDWDDPGWPDVGHKVYDKGAGNKGDGRDRYGYSLSDTVSGNVLVVQEISSSPPNKVLPNLWMRELRLTGDK